MIFQALLSGQVISEWINTAKKDPLPNGSQLVNATINFDSGFPIIKLDFMNYKPEIIKEYEEGKKDKPAIIRLLPNWQEVQPIKAEVMNEPPKIKTDDKLKSESEPTEEKNEGE